MRVPRFLVDWAVVRGAALRRRRPARRVPACHPRALAVGLFGLGLLAFAPATADTGATQPPVTAMGAEARAATVASPALQDTVAGLTLADIERAIWLIDDIAVYFDELAVSERNRHAKTAWQRTADNYRSGAARLQDWFAGGRVAVRDLPDGRAIRRSDERLTIDPQLDGLWPPARVAAQRRVGGDDWPFISRLSSLLFAQVGQLRRVTDWPWYREQLRRLDEATPDGEASQSADLLRFAFLKDKYLLLSILVEAAPRETLRELWADRRRGLVAEADIFLERHQQRFGRESSERLAKAWAEYSGSALTLSLSRADVILAPDAVDAYATGAETPSPPVGAAAQPDEAWPPPIGAYLPERRKDLSAVVARLHGDDAPAASDPQPDPIIDLADAAADDSHVDNLPGTPDDSAKADGRPDTPVMPNEEGMPADDSTFAAHVPATTETQRTSPDADPETAGWPTTDPDQTHVQETIADRASDTAGPPEDTRSAASATEPPVEETTDVPAEARTETALTGTSIPDPAAAESASVPSDDDRAAAPGVPVAGVAAPPTGDGTVDPAPPTAASDTTPTTQTAQAEGPAPPLADSATPRPAVGGTQIEIPPEIAELEPAGGGPAEQVGGPAVSLPTPAVRDLFDRLAGLAGAWINAVGADRTPTVIGIAVTMLFLLGLTLLWMRSLARAKPTPVVEDDDRLIVIVRTNDPIPEPDAIKPRSAALPHRGRARSTGWADAGVATDRTNARTAETLDVSPHNHGDPDLMSATQAIRNPTADASDARNGTIDTNDGPGAPRPYAAARQRARRQDADHATIHLRDLSSSLQAARHHLDRVAVEQDAQDTPTDGDAAPVAAAPARDTDAAVEVVDAAQEMEATVEVAEVADDTESVVEVVEAEQDVKSAVEPGATAAEPEDQPAVPAAAEAAETTVVAQSPEPKVAAKPEAKESDTRARAAVDAPNGAAARSPDQRSKTTTIELPQADERDLTPTPAAAEMPAARPTETEEEAAATVETRNGSAAPRPARADQPCAQPCTRPDLAAMEEMKANGLFSDDQDEVTTQHLIEALREGKLPLFKAWFGDLTRLQRARVDRMVNDAGGEDLVLACRAVGIEKLSFASIFIAIRKQCLGEKRIAPRKLARAMALYDEVDPAVGQQVLARWRRDQDFPGLVEYIAKDGKGLSDYQRLAEAPPEARNPVSGAHAP